MRVLLADGDPDVRGALRLLLTHDLGMQVIGEPVDATTLRAQVHGVRPDLLLLDWALVGAAAGATMSDLRALAPGLRIVVLSAHPETRPKALAAGADAFVSKTEAPAQLLATLRALPGAGPAQCADDTTSAWGGHDRDSAVPGDTGDGRRPLSCRHAPPVCVHQQQGGRSCGRGGSQELKAAARRDMIGYDHGMGRPERQAGRGTVSVTAPAPPDAVQGGRDV